MHKKYVPRVKHFPSGDYVKREKETVGIRTEVLADVASWSLLTRPFLRCTIRRTALLLVQQADLQKIQKINLDYNVAVTNDINRITSFRDCILVCNVNKFVTRI
jgi:hypothetical protein